jgi:hypothetical protein
MADGTSRFVDEIYTGAVRAGLFVKSDPEG